MTRSGQRFTFTNKSWNGTLGPNATASFGFIGAGNGDPTELHGQRHLLLRRRWPPANPAHPATPGNFRVTGTTAQRHLGGLERQLSGTVTGYRVYEGSTVRATVTGTQRDRQRAAGLLVAHVHRGRVQRGR